MLKEKHFINFMLALTIFIKMEYVLGGPIARYGPLKNSKKDRTYSCMKKNDLLNGPTICSS